MFEKTKELIDIAKDGMDTTEDFDLAVAEIVKYVEAKSFTLLKLPISKSETEANGATVERLNYEVVLISMNFGRKSIEDFVFKVRINSGKSRPIAMTFDDHRSVMSSVRTIAYQLENTMREHVYKFEPPFWERTDEKQKVENVLSK